MEGRKDEFKQGLGSLKYDLDFIKEDILNEIMFLNVLNSSTREEDKNKQSVKFQPHIRKFDAKLKKNRFDFLTFDHSSLQDPNFHWFNSRPRNYHISI